MLGRCITVPINYSKMYNSATKKQQMLREILEKNTHMLQEVLFVDSTAESASVRDVDDIVDELLEVQSEPKEESQ